MITTATLNSVSVRWVHLTSNIVQEEGTTPSGYTPCFSSSAFPQLETGAQESGASGGKNLIRQPLRPGVLSVHGEPHGKGEQARGVIWCLSAHEPRNVPQHPGPATLPTRTLCQQH